MECVTLSIEWLASHSPSAFIFCRSEGRAWERGYYIYDHGIRVRVREPHQSSICQYGFQPIKSACSAYHQHDPWLVATTCSRNEIITCNQMPIQYRIV